MRCLVVPTVLCVLLVWCAPLTAGDYEKGIQAIEAGDFDRAIAIWRPLAKSGDANAQASLGRLLLARADMEGLTWIRKSAARGNIHAELSLGMYHVYGAYVPKDLEEAEAWLRRAVSHEPTEQRRVIELAALARLALAQLLIGQDRADEGADRMLREAADMGDANAQFAYAQVLESGGKSNPVVAHTYYVLSSKQDGVDGWAKRGARELRANLTEAQLAASQAQIQKWLEARDSGKHGQLFGAHEKSKGELELEARGEASGRAHFALLLEAGGPSCDIERRWTRSRVPTDLLAPSSGAWIERWAVDACGEVQEFLVRFERGPDGYEWAIEGAKVGGAKTPEAVVARAATLFGLQDFGALVHLVAPDERPLLSVTLISSMQMLHAFLANHGEAGEVGKQFDAQAAFVAESLVRLLEKHGLPLDAKLPPSSVIQDPEAVSRWWRSTAPDMNHDAFIAGVLDAQIELVQRGIDPWPLMPFVKLLGETAEIEIDGSSATARINIEQVRFRRVDERWYLSLSDHTPQPEAPSGEVAPKVAGAERAFHRGDFDSARATWREGAARGERDAQYDLGRLLLASGDMKGFGLIQESARAGHLPAQAYMSGAHRIGFYVPHDRDAAFEWALKATSHRAADQAKYRAETAAAQRNLAWLYGEEGKYHDLKKAATMMKRRADAGLADAQLTYGWLLQGGGTGEPDLVEAYKYFVLSWKQGGDSQDEAQSAAQWLRERMPKAQFEESRKRVRAWLDAKEAGTLGWLAGQEARRSAGEKWLDELDAIVAQAKSEMWFWATREACTSRDQYWLQSREVVGEGKPGDRTWTESWTLQRCGEPATVSVTFIKGVVETLWRVAVKDGRTKVAKPSTKEDLARAYFKALKNKDYAAIEPYRRRLVDVAEYVRRIHRRRSREQAALAHGLLAHAGGPEGYVSAVRRASESLLADARRKAGEDFDWAKATYGGVDEERNKPVSRWVLPGDGSVELRVRVGGATYGFTLAVCKHERGWLFGTPSITYDGLLGE